MQGRAFRHTHLTQDHTLVFLWNKTGRHDLHEEHEQDGGTRQQRERQPRALEVFLHSAFIFTEDSVVAGLIGNLGVVIDAFPFLTFYGFLVVRTHQ